MRKHARAHEVQLELSVASGALTSGGLAPDSVAPRTLALSIRDDGVGFTGDRASGGGFGLESMRERAHAVGGELTITSAPGAGTTVAINVPERAPVNRGAEESAR